MRDSLCVCAGVIEIESEKERAAAYKHLTAGQAAIIAKKAKVKKLILTHISQRYENNLGAVLKESRKVFKNSVIVKDFDRVVV